MLCAHTLDLLSGYYCSSSVYTHRMIDRGGTALAGRLARSRYAWLRPRRRGDRRPSAARASAAGLARRHGDDPGP